MFKKPLSNLKTSAPLRSSDRRKLKQRIVQTYDVSAEIGDVLVPEGLMSQKIATYTNDPGKSEKKLVYFSSDGDPLWFSVGKGVEDLIPTVYTLWKKYDLLPYVSTPDAVIPILVGGADLMVPGVMEISSQTILPPQLIAVTRCTDGPSNARGPPLAVGRLAVDVNALKAGGKGKAVHVLHTWKDHLFDMGSKADPPGEVNVEVVGEPQEAKAEQSMEAAALESQGGDSRELHGVNDGASTGIVQPLGPADQDPRAAPFQFTNEEVSEILRGAVLQAIQSTVKSLPTASFPIAAGTYYSSYILPFRPAYLHNHRSETDGSSPAAAEGRRQGTSPYPPIDIKHSSYKSLTALFKSLDKQRILTLKDMKPEPLVTSVSASHRDVVSHRSYVTLRDVQLRQEKREKREEEERSRVKEMEIRELWKPHAASGSGRFFLEGGFDTSALYTYAELKAAVVKYITARQLINARDQSYANVSADELLLNTLAGKNESHENLEFLKREEVVQRLSEKMQSWYEVCAEGKEPVLKKGQLKPISVVVKTRQGRRASTLISGFEPFCIEADEMAEELRRICAGATSVSPIHGKATGMEVSVQGKQIKAVTNFLHSRGVPKKWIEAVDQTGKK